MAKVVDGRLKRGEKTKQAIIRATLSILAENGKQGLTSRAIAEKAGIAKGSVFHHFPNMKEILRASYEKVFERLDFPTIVKGDENLQTGMKMVMDEIMEMPLQHRDVYTASIYLLQMMREDESLQDDVVRHYRVVVEMFEKFISDRCSADVDPDRLKRGTLAYITILEGMWMLIYSLDNLDEFLDLAEDISSLLAGYIEGKPRK